MAKRRTIRRASAEEESVDSSAFTQSLVKGIRATCGKEAATIMRDYDSLVRSKVKTWVPSGFASIDGVMSGGRGIPCGKIIEIFGDEGTGKTALSQFFIKEFQKRGGVAVYLDFETSLDTDHLREYAIDLGNLIYVDVETVEEGFDAMLSVLEQSEASMKKGENVPILIVWDSVAMAVPKAETEEKSHDKSHVGLLARAMSKGMRKIRRKIAKTNCTCIFTNQTRDKIGVMFGEKTTTPGGKGLRFAASIRMRTSILKTLVRTHNKRKIRIGYIIGVYTKKTRFAAPHQMAKFILSFKNGPDVTASMLEYLRDLGLVRVVAKKLSYTPTKEEFTKKEWREFYKANRRKIMAEVKKAAKEISTIPDDDGGDEE